MPPVLDALRPGDPVRVQEGAVSGLTYCVVRRVLRNEWDANRTGLIELVSGPRVHPSWLTKARG